MPTTSSRRGQRRAERAHSPFGPSSSHRWLVCPGSIQATANLPRESSTYAEHGTAAHELLEASFVADIDPERYLGTTFNGFEVDEDMTTAVGHAVDYVRGYLRRHRGATYHVEKRMEVGKAFNPPRRDIFGTCDIMIDAYQLRTVDEAVFIDYKHGAGVPVDVVGNTQLMAYALGWRAETRRVPDKYRFVIIQPRSKAGGPPVQEWTATNADLNELRNRMVTAIARAEAPNPPFQAGSHCRFCRALPTCRAAAAAALERAMADFTSLEATPMPRRVRPTMHLTASELSAVYSDLEFIRAWVGAIQTEMARRLAAGAEEIKDWKLVAGPRRRLFNPAVKQSVIMRRAFPRGMSIDMIAPRKLLSYPRAKALVNLLGTKADLEKLESYMVRSRAKLHVAHKDDPRPAVMAPSTEFEAIEEDLDEEE